MLIDISRPLSPATAAFPGDTPTAFSLVARISAACPVNVGQLSCSAHAATHLDAPFHYDPTGQTIDQLDLSLLLGPATVVHLPNVATLTIADIPAMPLHPRLLIGTHAWRDPAVFPADFPTLAPDVPAYLAGRGVRLLGIDLPSVDKPDSKALPIHHALRAAGVLILENLDLTRAPSGEYQLTALPLLIPGADASPVRAVLTPLSRRPL